MDFKSLMSAQIAKSKPSSTATAKSISQTSNSKYLRRADLEAERQAQYAAEQARTEVERAERVAKKRQLEEEEAELNAVREEKRRKLAEESRARREAELKEEEIRRRRRVGLPDLPDESESKNEEGTPEVDDLADEEDEMADDTLQSRLRALSQPAILFDETYSSRLTRYRDLIKKSKPSKIKPKPQLSNTPIPTIIPLLPESDIPLLPAPPLPKRGTEAHSLLYVHLASYFTLVLSEWSQALANREPQIKQSTSGIQASRTYDSVLKDLTPMFRRFETQLAKLTSKKVGTSALQSQKQQKNNEEEGGEEEDELLEAIISITHQAQRRRYVAANDEYLKLSIGKAAWPIGVTMVGIHERSAREKLHEHGDKGKLKKAHIMTDEVTRKMLQSLKRCLSFAQTRWPPEDMGQLMG